MTETGDNREIRTGRTRPRRIAERSVALFLLGLVCFTPPLLGIFGMRERVLGLPVLYLYLFAVWGVLIALAARIAGRRRGDGDATGPEEVDE
jgi:hypothetical protein